MTGHARPFGLMEAAAWLGEMVWWERRSFEVLGGWTTDIDDAATKAMVDRHAQHHSWRAGQLWDRLPVLAQVDRAELVEAPATATASMVGALARTTSPVGRLAGAYRVALPRLAGAYRERLRTASPVSDGPIIRTLEMVVADVEADRREGEDRLHGLLATPAETFAAGYTVARLESILIGASAGVTGP